MATGKLDQTRGEDECGANWEWEGSMGTCDEMMNDEVSVKSYNFKTKERRAAPDNAAALKTRRSPQLAPFSPPNCYLPCIILGQQQQTKCTACQHNKRNMISSAATKLEHEFGLTSSRQACPQHHEKAGQFRTHGLSGINI